MSSSEDANSYYETFSKLSLPPLHDILLGSEKVAVQISKQNKEISALREIIQKMVNLSEDELEEKHTLLTQELKEKEKELSLLETHLISVIDSVFYMTNAVNEAIHYLKNTFSFSHEDWGSKPKPCTCQLHQIINALTDGCSMIQQKMETYLQALSIDLIYPDENDPFNPSKHRAIEQCKNGTPGTIAKVLRCGYEKKGAVLRFADVKIYI